MNWKDRLPKREAAVTRTVTIPAETCDKLDWLKEKLGLQRPAIVEALVAAAFEEEGGSAEAPPAAE